MRGGITIEGNWSADQNSLEAPPTDAIGRFAAALAIPLLDAKAGETWARSHSLCTHSTSLVLVDDASQGTEGFSQMRKVANMAARYSAEYSFPRLASHSLPRPARLARLHNKVSDRGTDSYSMDSWEDFHAPYFSRKMSVKRVMGKKNKYPKPSTSKRPSSISGLKSLMARILRTPKDPAEVTFQAFEWDRNGDALLAGDFSSLDPAQHRVVRQIAEALQNLSAINAPTIDEDALAVYALGLIARKIDDRLAARFARRALNGAANWVLAYRA